MKRTRKNKRKADFILTSDLHLTDKIPVSRTDNYSLSQKKKLRFLSELSEQNGNCPILCAGDVFDYWKASPWLIREAYLNLPRPFVCIPGQHDLPGHSLSEFDRSALAVLRAVEEREQGDQSLHVLFSHKGFSHENTLVLGIPFGQLEEVSSKKKIFSSLRECKRRILLIHELTWPDKRPSWDSSGWTAEELIDKFGEYFDLIVTGDNHMSFVRQKGNCILVNPGSMARITADQVDHQPKCYLYYADTNEVKAVPFPIEKDVFNTEHLTRKKEKDQRIAAYIEKLKDFNGQEITLSFCKNLEIFFRQNNVPKEVKELIMSCLDKI